MFLHPWAIAAGIIAAGLPLAVHFLTKPKPRTLPFSALRFVREVVEERKTRHRLRDFVILALRTAAVLLLAAAIARPLLNSARTVAADDNAQVVRIVILDVSQSMAAVQNGVTLLERARPRAARRLEQQTGMKANLIFAAARPAAVFERPSTNYSLLHEELSQAKPLPQQAQVQPVLNLAGEMFSASAADAGVRRELLIISDFQRSNWSAADFSVLPADTHIELESVAPNEPAPNLGLLRLAVLDRPEEGREFRVAADVGNYSPTPRNLRIELTVGSSAFQLSGLCAPYSKTTLVGDVRSPAVGWHVGQARIIDGDDGLAEDNTRPFVLEVRPPAKFGLLTRQSPQQRPSSSYFLERALAPTAESNDASSEANAPRNTVSVVRLDPASLDLEALSTVELLVIDHPGKLGPDAAVNLASLLRRGRGILYVAAEAVDATNLRQLADATNGRLNLPVDYLPPAGNRGRRDLFLADVRQRQPPFQIFGDDLNRLIGPLRISGGLDTRLKDGAVLDDIYAQLNDRSAWLAFAAADGGRVIVMNADLSASNLPSSPLFVPLMGELVQSLIGQGNAQREVTCGEPFVVPLSAEFDSLDELKIEGIGTLTRESAETLWKGDASGPPAVQRVIRRGVTVSAIATTIPAVESDLRTLSADVFQERLAGGRNLQFRKYSGKDDTEEKDTLWSWFAVCCAACLIGEVAALKAFRT